MTFTAFRTAARLGETLAVCKDKAAFQTLTRPDLQSAALGIY